MATKKRAKARSLLDGRDRRGIALARRAGLFLLVEGAGPGKRWVVYRKADGAHVATLYPDDGRVLGHAAGVNAGRYPTWEAAIRACAPAG